MTDTTSRAAFPDPFTYRRIDADGVAINTAVGGSGEPVLLLHGYPESHLTWLDVAPALAEQYTVVATDLRGYGDSDKPAPDPEHRTYSKREMAKDQVEVMRQLGFDRFHLICHDRGARVGQRLALDFPDAVASFGAFDIVPTRHVLTHVDHRLATSYFHWFLTATAGGIPERLIGGDPQFWIEAMIDRLLGPGATIDPAVKAEYVRAFSDPAAIAATCEDYRCGATSDMADDDASAAAGKKVTTPTLLLWGELSFVGRAYDPIAVWQQYATDVQGRGLPTGHFVPEERPDLVLAELEQFLARHALS